MSTSGIQVFNNYSTMQISSDYTNMVLYSKGTVTTVAPTTPYRVGTTTNPETWGGDFCNSKTTFTTTSLPPKGVFAFSSTVPIGVGSIVIPLAYSNTASFTLVSEGAIGSNITWYYFCPCEVLTPSTHGIGLQVFDSTGALTYDSSYPLMKIVDYVNPYYNYLDNTIASRVYPSGKSYAIIPSGLPGVKVGSTARGSAPGGGYAYDRVSRPTMGYVSSNTIYFKNIQGSILSQTYPNSNYWDAAPTSWSNIIIDVTNL